MLLYDDALVTIFEVESRLFADATLIARGIPRIADVAAT